MRKQCSCGTWMEVENDDVDFCDACAQRFTLRLQNMKTHCFWCGHPLNITDTPLPHLVSPYPETPSDRNE